MGSDYPLSESAAFIVTLMGIYFARGLAYIISLDSIPIENAVYKAIGLTPLYIPLIPKAYVYLMRWLGRGAHRGCLFEFLHALWPHHLRHWQ